MQLRLLGLGSMARLLCVSFRVTCMYIMLLLLLYVSTIRLFVVYSIPCARGLVQLGCGNSSEKRPENAGEIVFSKRRHHV